MPDKIEPGRLVTLIDIAFSLHMRTKFVPHNAARSVCLCTQIRLPCIPWLHMYNVRVGSRLGR
jgi:hypothetical protein